MLNDGGFYGSLRRSPSPPQLFLSDFFTSTSDSNHETSIAGKEQARLEESLSKKARDVAELAHVLYVNGQEQTRSRRFSLPHKLPSIVSAQSQSSQVSLVSEPQSVGPIGETLQEW